MRYWSHIMEWTLHGQVTRDISWTTMVSSFFFVHDLTSEGITVLMWILNFAPQDKRRLLRMQMQ